MTNMTENSSGVNPENNSIPNSQPAPQATKEANPQEQNIKKGKFKEILKEIVIFAVIAIGIVLPFRVYVAEPYLVDGRSMDPTFKTGDYLIVDKFSYRRSGPERNTVLVFKYPGNPSKSFIKRVIGLPGETVIVKDSTVTIVNSENPNGIKIDQSYVVYEMPGDYNVTLSGDEYFVMGDNRAESFDSRSWGALNKKYILGKPLVQLWPLSQIKLFPGQDNK